MKQANSKTKQTNETTKAYRRGQEAQRSTETFPDIKKEEKDQDMENEKKDLAKI